MSSSAAGPIATSIKCADGYVLAGTFWKKNPAAAASASAAPKRPILIAPATGVTTRFYSNFATWLAEERGHDVLSFDFRGIGKSLKGNVAKSDASIVQWGQLDLPAAIDTLEELTGKSSKMTLVGHSAGGQLLGIAPNYEKVAKVVAISGSTGYNGLQKPINRFLLAPFMFSVMFPIGCATVGYGPTKMIGMGENLPKNVARQWAHFCSKPGYILNAIEQKREGEASSAAAAAGKREKDGLTVFAEDDFHSKITAPITCFYAADDAIATAGTVQDLLRLYPSVADKKAVELVPKDHGVKAIGHMAMFKKSHKHLWDVFAKEL